MLFNLLLVLLVGSSAMAAAVIKPCPPAAEIAPCTCMGGYDDFSIDCDASQSDGQQIRSMLKHITTYGEIKSLKVYGIETDAFSVPEDFLAGNQVEEMIFECRSETKLPHFDSRAFISADGTCGGLTDDFTIWTCNMGDMDASFLENCNKLTMIDLQGDMKSFSNLPRLEGLKNLVLVGHTEFVELNIKASDLSNITVLMLEGELEIDDIAFTSDMNNIERFHLIDNKLTTCPDLRRLRKLSSFSMQLALPSNNVSIMLPTTRENALDFLLFSFLDDTYHISTLQGSFERINMTLNFKQDSFPEALFSAPLKAGASMIFLKKNPFPCGCDIAWLVRQPELMYNIVDGMCANGLLFKELDPADFAHC